MIGMYNTKSESNIWTRTICQTSIHNIACIVVFIETSIVSKNQAPCNYCMHVATVQLASNFTLKRERSRKPRRIFKSARKLLACA